MNGGANPFAHDEDFVPVAEFDSRAEVEEYALVVLAMGFPCLILEAPAGAGRGYEILAARAQADAVGEEFAAYAAERREPPAEKLELPVFNPDLGLALLWVVTLFVVFGFQMQYPWVTGRFSNSSLDLFDGGEWWRPFTAMFLHADDAHLLGNVVFGLIFFLPVTWSVGPRTGWLLILISGTLANMLTAWLRYPTLNTSLGASTATFAALGILVGFSALVSWRMRSYRRLGGLIVPFGAGIFLLGWLGSGAPPTDVLGHLAAFAVGCLSGVIAGVFRVAKAA